MKPNDSDHAFAGAIPQIYERYLVPLIFAPYAIDMAARVAARQPSNLLEIAAGTGVVTRLLAEQLPNTSIVATDLNPAMLERAAAIGTSRPVEWRQADAMTLPFEDRTFDVVACQFGVMFFPDKDVAYREALRVLRPGGRFLFNVWHGLEHNDLADLVTRALATRLPAGKASFLSRVPHGYHDIAQITSRLHAAGFGASIEVEDVKRESLAASAHHAALAFCQGTPLRGEIDQCDTLDLQQATAIAEAALIGRFGAGSISGRLRALVFEADRLSIHQES
jgi:SAM-dependent methyltransferase